MNCSELVDMSIAILQISQEFMFHTDDPYTKKCDFELHTFSQTWGNTSGGFEGIGGSAMTDQQTYVLIPVTCNEHAQVYFGGRFAYKAPMTNKFLEDIANENVAGLSKKSKYLMKD